MGPRWWYRLIAFKTLLSSNSKPIPVSKRRQKIIVTFPTISLIHGQIISVVYHYDSSGMPSAASFPPHFGMISENIDPQLENIGMNLEQQLVLHQEEIYGSLPSLMPFPPGSLGYWPAEQQQISHQLLPAGYCPPPHHHMQQQQQCANPPVGNGEMAPMTVFFSTPFPYQLST